VLFGLACAEACARLWQFRFAGPAPVATERVRPVHLFETGEVELPVEFPAPKADGDVDIIVVGESSAEGVPYNEWISIGKLVAWQLQEIIPARRFRLEVLATSGETLERQHVKLAGLTRRPDALLIYCGHNEFSARFPWSREAVPYHDAPPPALGAVLVARLERRSALCALIGRTADKCRVALPPPPEARRALVDVPAYRPEEFDALLADFRRRLERIVTYAERIGAVPILIVPPGNDSGFEPNRSFLPTPSPYAERAALAREFETARRLEASDAAGAQRRYESILARQPGFAEAHYRLARLLERHGAWDEAYDHAILARDRDGLPVRCPAAFQEAYRTVAARHTCILVDGQAYFHAIGPHGMLDDNLFNDAMHPSLRGQIALAQAVLQGLRARRAFGWPEEAPAPVLDPACCARHFGLGQKQWQKLCDWGVMVYDLLSPLHYDPSHRRARQAEFGKARDRIRDGTAPEAAGMPNIGVPEPVPLVTDAAVLTHPP
jgi:hypothetical protein